MKMKEAIELAKSCGLKTYREAINNVQYHAMNIFVYDEIGAELNELVEDFKSTGMNPDDEF